MKLCNFSWMSGTLAGTLASFMAWAPTGAMAQEAVAAITGETVADLGIRSSSDYINYAGDLTDFGLIEQFRGEPRWFGVELRWRY